MKRVLATKSFVRWCTLSDAALCAAAREIEQGLYEADLGKGVVKKRVAYPGRGKSAGARLLVAQRITGFVIFLVGRDKNDPGSDFTREQEDAAKELALVYASLDSVQFERAIGSGVLKEIDDGDQEIAKP